MDLRQAIFDKPPGDEEMITLTPLFCEVDDFCREFIPKWEQSLLADSPRKRRRSTTMSPAEVIVIVLLFQQSHYRDFKNYYLHYVPRHLGKAFPARVSYNRFVELMNALAVPMCAYLQTRLVNTRGIAFVDSTPLKVCHNLRIPRHRTLHTEARRGKSSTGWFYGFKLHLIVNDQGEIVALFVSPGNLDDRKGLKAMLASCKNFYGKLFGDKGYLSKVLQEELLEQGIELVTRVRKNMTPKQLSVFDKLMLRKRAIIETINDQLKNVLQLEHTRHRSCAGFIVNLLAAVIAYTWLPQKPAIRWDDSIQSLLEQPATQNALIPA